MNRGARKEMIFKNVDHCILFLEMLSRSAERYGIEVHAYALMPNHYHLLVRSVHGNVSRFMKDLIGPYTLTLNLKHGWDGPIFKGRFKSQIVSYSDHLRALVPYIHLNPVVAGLVAGPELAVWSSYPVYAGVQTKPDWLATEALLELYNGAENLMEETRGFQCKALKWPSDFDLRRGFFRAWDPEIPRTPEQRKARGDVQFQHAQHVVSAVTSLSWEEVCVRKRGRGGNTAQRLAVWLLATTTDLTHVEIGRRLDISSSHVGVLLNRMRKGKVNPQLSIWMEQARFWSEPPREQAPE
jgi:REP element-mobilizing transposase RayT